VGCASSPWDWQPSRVSWQVNLRPKIQSWIANLSLDVDKDELSHTLYSATGGISDWLFHPIIHGIFSRMPTLQNNIQFLAWINLHTGFTLGRISLERPVWLWSKSGGSEVEPGQYQIEDLAQVLREDNYSLPLALDVWCESASPNADFDFGFDKLLLWRACFEAQVRVGTPSMEDDTLRFLRAVALLAGELPNCAQWLRPVAHVVVPFVPSPGMIYRSNSHDDLPGMIFSDLKDQAQIVETIIHESAHHYFRIAEAAGPFIAADHLDKYPSPLRRDPRPLRGVFLAYHALAYMSAFYHEALSVGLELIADEALEDLNRKAIAAERTIDAASAHLTGEGKKFFERTGEVAAWSRRPVEVVLPTFGCSTAASADRREKR
jgi:hypothetical protein